MFQVVLDTALNMTESYVQACALRHRPPSSVCLPIPNLASFVPYMRNPNRSRHITSVSPRVGKSDHPAVAKKYNTQKSEVGRRRNYGGHLHGLKRPAVRTKILSGSV